MGMQDTFTFKIKTSLKWERKEEMVPEEIEIEVLGAGQNHRRDPKSASWSACVCLQNHNIQMRVRNGNEHACYVQGQRHAYPVRWEKGTCESQKGQLTNESEFIFFSLLLPR